MEISTVERLRLCSKKYKFFWKIFFPGPGGGERSSFAKGILI